VLPLANTAGKVNPDINPNHFPNPSLRLTVTDFKGHTTSCMPLWKKRMDS